MLAVHPLADLLAQRGGPGACVGQTQRRIGAEADFASARHDGQPLAALAPSASAPGCDPSHSLSTTLTVRSHCSGTTIALV